MRLPFRHDPLIRAAVFLCLAPCLAGCAYVEQKFADVTHDPQFAVAYRPDEVYRLKHDGKLVVCGSSRRLPGKSTGRLELSSAAGSDPLGEPQSGGSIVAVVPAGSLLRIDGLEHNYTFALPPVPGDSQVLQAYGTLTTAAGQRWVDVRVPDDRTAKWSFVGETHVMAFPRDENFLERLDVDRPRRPAAHP
jgi:hypothetical protein